MEALPLQHERCFFCSPTPAGWPKGGTLLAASGPCLSPASWAALQSWRPSSSIRPGGASMVLATFAETKVARRTGAKPRNTLKTKEVRQKIVAPYKMGCANPRLPGRTPAHDCSQINGRKIYTLEASRSGAPNNALHSRPRIPPITFVF